MNCTECNEQLVAYVEGLLDEGATAAVESHAADCPTCRTELDEIRRLHERLMRSGQAAPRPSLDGCVMDRIIREQATTIRRLKMRKRYRLIGAGSAMAAAVVGLLFVTLWSGAPNGRAEAAEVLAQAASAASDLQSVHIRCRMRTLPRDNFEIIGVKYDFVDVEMWKQFGEQTRWRIEIPGRVTIMDGASTVMLIKPTANYPGYAWKHEPTSWSGVWLKSVLDVEKIIDRELRSASEGGSDLELTHEKTDDGTLKLVVIVEAEATVGETDYLRNKYIAESDNRRVYRFDAETKRLEDLKVYIHTEEGDVLIFEITDIEYGEQIDPSVFALELPEDVIWFQEPQLLPDNEKYERMTPKEAAQAFFEACANEDWDEMIKFETVSRISKHTKEYLGGLEIIQIGEPFKAGRYPGWFVPYEIRLKSGRVKKHNLALRKDNPARRFVVDGGI